MKQDEYTNPIHQFIMAVIILLILTLAMFSDVLFTSKSIVLSEYGGDLSQLFTYWREFGFGQLRHGHMALWNPYIFSGMPYLGESQSALFYPFNFIYLIFSIPKAVDCDIALSVFLAGLFTYLWTSYRRLDFVACLLCAVLYMFSSAFFLHIYPGHLNRLSEMIWAPLILLAIDGIAKKNFLGWCLAGMFFVAMQIFAGDPQYVFYTAIAVSIYAVLLMAKEKKWVTLALGLIYMYMGAVALSAVQLLPGLNAANESIRTGGLSMNYAAMFSFPWQSFITLLTPKFFGDEQSVAYWGLWYFWETTFFISITGLFLAIYGFVYGDKKKRQFSMAMTIILLTLALGSHTPLFKIFYTWVPGFSKFRGMSKFIFPATLFLIMLTGVGLDHLIQEKRVNRKAIVSLLILVLLTLSVGLVIQFSFLLNPMGLWQKTMTFLYNPHESYFSPNNYLLDNFVQTAGFNASKCLILSAGTCLLLAILLFLIKYSSRWVYAVGLLAVIEIFTFARTSRPSFDLAITKVPEIENILSEHPGDYRYLYEANPNLGMSIGGRDLWGYDPLILQRYAQFMFYTQGQNPDQATPYLKFKVYHPLYKMLRCRYIFNYEGEKFSVQEIKDVLPQFLMINDYQVIKERNDIFKAMQDKMFDPRQKVILESNPNPVPVNSNDTGQIKVLDFSTDQYTLEADISHPAILLMTDAYSQGWHARALPGSVQMKYDLLPANYILRAIPLSAGHHHIKIEYLPKAYQTGKWISIVSFVLYFCCIAWFIQKRYFHNEPYGTK